MHSNLFDFGLANNFGDRVMSLLLLAGFFAALDRGVVGASDAAELFVNDTTRGKFLKMSRGLALILLAVFVAATSLPA